MYYLSTSLLLHGVNRIALVNPSYIFRLDALDPNAYPAFQASRDLRDVVERVIENRESGDKSGLSKKLSIRASLMTPVLPMLVCKLMSKVITYYNYMYIIHCNLLIYL